MSLDNPSGGTDRTSPDTAVEAGAARTSRVNPETRGALCVKCEHLNPGTIEACEVCGAHLYVKCLQCGAKNRRVNTRCETCQRRLHKGRSRGSDRSSGRAGMNLWVVGMIVGGILFTMFLLFLISGLKLPRLW